MRVRLGSGSLRRGPPQYGLTVGMFGPSRRFCVESDRGVLIGFCRVRRVELPVALLDSASTLMPCNRDADVVRPNPLARGSDFLPRLAHCQGKDLIAEAWRAAVAAGRFGGRDAPTPP
jgi:hypothetical protein